MRIVRYELEIVDYQQIQPLWPGRILAVKPGRIRQHVRNSMLMGEDLNIDMWCLDAEIPVDESPPTQTPVLGVWIVGTGNPMPERLVQHGNEVELDRVIKYHQDTCVMRDGLVRHVFTAVIGYAEPISTGYGDVSSVDDIADKVAARRRDELQRIADMPRTMQDRHA